MTLTEVLGVEKFLFNCDPMRINKKNKLDSEFNRLGLVVFSADYKTYYIL